MNSRLFLLICAVILIAAGLVSCTAARPTEPAAVVQTANARLNKGDVDGFVALYAPDALMTDPHGRHAGSQEIRKYASEMVSQKFRFELSDFKVDGNVVTYTARLYIPTLGDKPTDTLKGLSVVKDGLIVFDGPQQLYELECEKDPTQVFCSPR